MSDADTQFDCGTLFHRDPLYASIQHSYADGLLRDCSFLSFIIHSCTAAQLVDWWRLVSIRSTICKSRNTQLSRACLAPNPHHDLTLGWDEYEVNATNNTVLTSRSLERHHRHPHASNNRRGNRLAQCSTRRAQRTPRMNEREAPLLNLPTSLHGDGVQAGRESAGRRNATAQRMSQPLPGLLPLDSQQSLPVCGDCRG